MITSFKERKRDKEEFKNISHYSSCVCVCARARAQKERKREIV